MLSAMISTRWLLMFCLLPCSLTANPLAIATINPSLKESDGGAVERSYGGSGSISVMTTPSTTTGSATPNSGFPTSNVGCFPNIINNTISEDKTKKLGRFHEYRSKSIPQQVYNAMFDNTLIGNGLVYIPGTSTPALHLTKIYQRVTISNNTNKCDNQNIVVLSKANGVDYSFDFDSDSAPVGPFLGVVYYLYDNSGPDGFEIIFLCDTPNHATGICEAIELYVNTRQHPNSMTDARKQAIDDIVNRTLKPYCLSISDLQRTIFRDDLPVWAADRLTAQNSCFATKSAYQNSTYYFGRYFSTH